MKEVSTNFAKLGSGKEDVKEVEGTLIEKSSMTFGSGDKANDVGRYKLQDDDDTIVTVLGSVKIDDLLESVPLGTYVKLEFVGVITTKGGMKMNDIKLSVESAEAEGSSEPETETEEATP